VLSRRHDPAAAAEPERDAARLLLQRCQPADPAVFFELGLNQIVVQLVSYEAAHLNQDAEGRWHG
jgi:hypothetical protein